MKALLFATMIATAGTAVAQTAPPTEDGPDVVVTARKGNQGQQVNDFVRALTNMTGPDPIGRFDRTDLCPGVVGLNENQNLAIATRMRRTGKAAGIPLAAEGCRPNALVIFAADKNAMIDALRKAHPIYFRDAMGRVFTVPRQPGPATAWHLSARIDRNGVQIQPAGDEVSFVTQQEGSSRISATVRPIFLASVVVIEWKAIDGLTTTQIADYAAMRSYAQIDPVSVQKSTAPTILTVLEAPMDSAVPLTMTQWDLGYLRGLYAAAPFHGSQSQRAAISRRINSELGKASTSTENTIASSSGSGAAR